MYKKSGQQKKKPQKKQKRVKSEEEGGEEVESDWVDEESDEDQNIDGSKKVKDEVLTLQYPVTDVKMVLVVREDLKMQKGKIGA